MIAPGGLRAIRPAGSFRPLIRGADSGEVEDFAGARTPVEALGIAPLAHRERHIKEVLDEVAARCHRARSGTVGSIRRDQGDDRDHAGIDERQRQERSTREG